MNKIERAIADLEDACSAIHATTRWSDERQLQSALHSIYRARKLLESANHDSKVVSDLTSWMED